MKILVALQSFGEYGAYALKLLENSGAEIILNKLGHRLNQAEIIGLGRDCDGIIAGVEPYDREVIANLTKLKCISRCGVGTDNIDLGFAEERGIKILITPNAVTQPVAEMTVAMIFDLVRLTTLHTNLLKAGRWEKEAGHLLFGRKAGVVGLGRIGKRVAEMLKALKVDVYGFDISPDYEWAKNHGIIISAFSEFIEEIDILCLHVSVLKEGKFFLGKDELARLKKGSIVVNTSRGKVVDETALYDALKSGHLAGAGLDVFSEEPYHGALLKLDNVVLTPHISTLTVESRNEMEKEAVENLLKYFSLPVNLS